MGRCPTPTSRDDENNSLKKGPWTPEEDQILVDYIQAHGHGSWRALPKLSELDVSPVKCTIWANDPQIPSFSEVIVDHLLMSSKMRKELQIKMD
nr:transcription factor MYB39-like [Tanacetum cinerariifolium]